MWRKMELLSHALPVLLDASHGTREERCDLFRRHGQPQERRHAKFSWGKSRKVLSKASQVSIMHRVHNVFDMSETVSFQNLSNLSL